MDNKKIKVLIGDDSAEYGITCANELRSLGLYVVTREKTGKSFWTRFGMTHRTWL